MFAQLNGKIQQTLPLLANYQLAQAQLQKLQLQKLIQLGGIDPKLIGAAKQLEGAGKKMLGAGKELIGMGKHLIGAGGNLKAKGQQLMAKDWKYKFQDQQVMRLSLDLKYPIFTGGKIRTGVKVKKLESEIAKVETEKIKGSLISELAERYFQTQLAEEAVKVREQNLESVKKHLYNAKKLEENGMLAPIQTMLAQTAVADAERNVLASKKDAELAKTALQGLLGGENLEFTKLTTNLFEINDLKPLEFYQNLAKKNHYDIVKAEIKKQLTEENINFQKANYIPDVALFGKKYLYSKNLPKTQPDDWYVGIGLKMDLFKGLQNRGKYQEAKALNESVQLLIEQAKIDIQTLVKKHYTEILKQKEQLVSLEKSIDFAKEVLRVRTKAFKEGFATSTDVADANLYLASIKIKRLKALFEIDKTFAKLLQTCGESETFSNYTI
ncbi:MAG: TolC family protein [Tenacibaculum sp.]|nr:TolC family protein [Tenacibaculum sp.]